MPAATSTFRIAGWKEEAVYEREDGARLNHARVTKTYEGELAGEGRVEYLMAYKADGSAEFSGYEIFTGTVAGRAGSFYFEHRGIYADGRVDSRWTVVEGSGAGELEGLAGSLEFQSGHQDEYEISFEYSI